MPRGEVGETAPWTLELVGREEEEEEEVVELKVRLQCLSSLV